ncbi:TPA: WGR and DUF4132 domain-containing protein [Klebsiella oxytoca]|nr:WGR and DUF4132 domain-containing protein [Klebsiella oxytoca]
MKSFIYQDEKSHKFWAVEQQDNELHLSWGKVGTSGQSQIKTFADSATAAKAKQKLIGEKTRKGYAENTAAEKSPPQAVASQSNNRPWLADDAHIPLTEEIGWFAFPHRNRSRPFNTTPDGNQIWQRITRNDKAEFRPSDYHFTSPAWEQAYAELHQRIKHNQSTGSLLSEAALLGQMGYYSGDLIDLFVTQYGLETTVEIACHTLQVACKYDDDLKKIVVRSDFPVNETEYLPDWLPRLCHHLSLAPEEEWLRCVKKLIAAIPELSPAMQPFVALMLPERPDIANEIALRFAAEEIPAMAWLKMVVNAPSALITLEKYPLPPLYSHFLPYVATLIANQGMIGVSQLVNDLDEKEASTQLPDLEATDYFTKWLAKTNHPDALKILILGAGNKNKRLGYLSKASQKYPHAAIAAYASLLTSYEDPIWRKALTVLISAEPARVEQVLPWIDAHAAETLTATRPHSDSSAEYASPETLPEILVSPPWLKQNQKSASPVFKLSILPVTSTLSLTPAITEELTGYDYSEYHCQFRYADLPPFESYHWEKVTEPFTPEQNFLWRLGFEKWQQLTPGTSQKVPIPQSAVTALQCADYATLINEFHQYTGKQYSQWKLYLLAWMPREQALALLDALADEPHKGEEGILPIFGIDALPIFVRYLKHERQSLWPFTPYCGTTDLALPMAQNFSRKKTLREDARNWLLEYPEHAIAGLLPAALGKACKDRDDAQQALRLLAENNHRSLITQIAQRYQQPEIIAALGAFLDAGDFHDFPTKIQPLPEFYQFALWRRPQLKSSGLPLPDNAMRYLGDMLNFPREVKLYAGLNTVKSICTPTSLANFAWDLFNAWIEAGGPSKANWAFTTLAFFGNDDTARALTPLIRAWPGESQHQRAALGLDILAEIGSDIALMLLNGIAKKIKFAALQENAQNKIKQIAEQRELTIAELEDRLAPDLGLDDNGTLVLDFGPRRFTVSFDEALKPFVRDESGRRLKDLPKPNKSDDETLAAAAVNRYKSLKKDARTVATQQIMRLETAMCLRRRWTAEQFRLFLVDHPLVRHLTRRLIWGVYSQENVLLACFRVAEDNSYSDAEDNLFSLPEGQIGLPHVLEISAEDAAAFGQLYADYELLPPFRQLDRNHYRLTESENRATELTRWRGRQCQAGRIVGLERKGWQRIEDGGSICGMFKPATSGDIVLEVEPFSLLYGETGYDELIPLDNVKIVPAGDIYFGKPAFAFSTLDAIAASELINDIESLFD